MKVYRQVAEDAEYREYYDSYRITVDNLNDTDFLYKSNLGNGQLYFKDDEVYGFVNNQPAIRGRNITITKEYIDDFVIRDFILYDRKSNEAITLNINCNLKNYRDGKPHYLYVVLSHRGTYEVYDDMFQSDEEKILFARFLIDAQGNSIQFYMMLPFAGSADYLKGNQFYNVTKGLRVQVVNNSTKQLTLSDSKIRFSAINFDDYSSPDCLTVEFNGNALPIRYVKWDNTDQIPRVDWNSNPITAPILNKIMNYSTGSMVNVDEDKFSLQKVYYDVYEKCLVIMYGDTVYNNRESAIYAIDSVMNYPLPDGIEYLIPVAVLVLKNSDAPFSEDTFRIVNLDYNETEILDSDSFTRQQAAEAVAKANQAITKANEVETLTNGHIGDRTNPHRVRLDQLYNSLGNPVTLADDYADYSVSSILARAKSNGDRDYYAKTGGEISGSTSITQNLTVAGTTTLSGTLSVSGAVTVGNNIIPSTTNTSNIGSTTSRFANIYSTSVNISGASTFSGTITSANIAPSTSATYSLGTTDLRYTNLYTRDVNASGNIASNSANITAGITAATGSFTTSVTTPKVIVSTNGNLVIGNYSLRLGGSGTIPTQNGYGIW